jgi:hypothetical protein
MLKDVELISFLGQPDSVVTENGWECGNYINGDTSVRILYYGKTKFMSSGGISLLYLLNLEDKRFTFDFGGKQLKKRNIKSRSKGILSKRIKLPEQGDSIVQQEGTNEGQNGSNS